jgi:hypothetical protein
VANDGGMVLLNHFGHQATLHVTVKATKQFRFRLWLSLRLIALAAWVSHANLQIDQKAPAKQA